MTMLEPSSARHWDIHTVETDEGTNPVDISLFGS